MPYRFEENIGQAPEGSLFVARGGNYQVYITQAGPVIAYDLNGKRNSIATQIRGGNPHARVSGEHLSDTRINYAIGNRSTAWLSNVANYSRVRYNDIYPDIDLVFYGTGHNLEFDFDVKPGGDPNKIALAWKDAEHLRLDTNGNLSIATPAGDLQWGKPVIYQVRDGRRTEIAGDFRLSATNTVSFHVADYDHSAKLVIDPTVSFATYLGMSGNESARGVALDPSGNVLIAGYSSSANLPTTGAAAQPGYGGSTSDTITGDAFVAKFNNTGSSLLWLTYLGGNQDDIGLGIAVDSSGNAYVTGMTNSTNFPVKNAQNPSFIGMGGNILNPMGDAFLTKLSSSGQIVYSTFFGGTADDWGQAVAVDNAGNAYITGATLSNNLPISVSTYQKGYKGSGGNLDYCTGCGPVFATGDAFATKFDANGKLVWTTYLGGSKDDIGNAIAVDKTGNVYVAGSTLSSDFPTSAGAFQTTFGGMSNNQVQPNVHLGDGFVVKLDPNGANLLWGTYLGGSQDDTVLGMAIDSNGAVYVTGATLSTNFPTSPGAFQAASAFKGPATAPLQNNHPTFVFGDGFVAKFKADGTALTYSTLFGGSGDDSGQSIAIDANGVAYIAGQTASKDFPVTSGAPQSSFSGSGGETQAVGDAFLLQLNATGTSVLFATYLGGGSNDAAGAVAVDGNGNAYVAGYTLSSNFKATTGSYQTVFGGWNRAGAPFGDAFVAKYSGLAVNPSSPTINPGGIVPVYSTSTAIQPGNWFSIYGNNLAAATTLWNGDFPTGLGSTTVTVNGKNAYLWFVSGGQINAQSPDDTATGSVPVTVSTAAGSTTATVNLAKASPSFLLLADDVHATGIILTPNGGGSQGNGSYDLLGPSSAGPGFRAAKRGESVALYGVGFGPTNPPVPAGQIYNCPPAGCAALVTLPQISVGGIQVGVAFGGIVGAGLYQFNFAIPSTVGSGDQTLVATVNGVQTQPSITIPIQ